MSPSRATLLALALGIGLGAATTARADFVAYNTATVQGNQAYITNLGLDFDVNQAIEVLSLGVFDSFGDGFNSNSVLTVTLWSRNNQGTASTDDDTAGSPLATMTFDAGSPGSLNGAFRFKSLGGQLGLAPGSYSIVAHGFNGGDLNLNENIGGTVTTDDGGGLIGFLGTGRYDTNSGAPAGGFPDNTTAENGFPGVTPHVFGAGSFEYRAADNGNPGGGDGGLHDVPEPTSMMLAILGAGGVVVCRARRRRPQAKDE